MNRAYWTILVIFAGVSLCMAKVSPESLLFMGRGNEVVTVASGRPELPNRAPASVTVVKRDQLHRYGFRTLRESLWMVPGFMTVRKNERYSLFARGVPSGALFLYDGIPLNTDSTKAVYPLGDELSMDYVKKIEVIRGPSSVLWGPDAFSGLVNLVPLRGSDVNGLITKGVFSSPDGGRRFSLLWGKDTGFLDVMGFLTVKGKKGYLGGQNHDVMEGVLNLFYRDTLNLLVRISRCREPYVTYGKGEHWISREDIPFSLVKIEYKKRLGDYLLDVKGAYTYWEIVKKERDLSWGYSTSSFFGDVRLSKDLFDKNALLTVGASFRRNLARNALISIRGYVPEYILSNSPFTPISISRSFDTSLTSLYAQYIYRYRWSQLWFGIRWDDHTDYKSGLSYNLGVAFYPTRGLYAKFIFGTSYRTPYADLFLKKKNIDPERASTISAEVGIEPLASTKLSATLFYTRVKHHVEEDSYAGYSSSSYYSTRGIELSFEWTPYRWLDAWLAYTLTGIERAYSRYRILDYIVILPDEVIYSYSRAKKRIDAGARQVLSGGVALNMDPVTLGLSFYYTPGYLVDNLATGKEVRVDRQLLVNVYATYRLSKDISLHLKVENLFDDRGYTMGNYFRVKREGLKAFLSLECRF